MEGLPVGTHTLTGMIEYRRSADQISPGQLNGFFVGWPNPPSPETHLRILQGSSHVELALNSETGSVVGFINAISDGVLTAYIPLLEVLPAYQKQGIGATLVQRMLERLRDFYMVDLVSGDDVQQFYERLGMQKATAMVLRRFDRQSGIARREAED